jgi:ParB family transcriptional regulator, chromosome partitioning protein
MNSESNSSPVPHRPTPPAYNLQGDDHPQLVHLALDLLDPDPDQPRRHIGDVTDLALSIRSMGLLNPIIVERRPEGRYRILAGERRFTACRQLGLSTLPCIVRTVEHQARLALQLIENLQRQDLTPIEEATALRRLMTEFNLSQRELALRIGKSVAAVNQMLRLLDLPPSVVADLQKSDSPSKSVLLEIAKEQDPDRQRELFDQSLAGTLTVRQARQSKPQSKPQPVVISLGDATVTLRFEYGNPTPERIAETLKKALEADRLRSDV